MQITVVIALIGLLGSLIARRRRWQLPGLPVWVSVALFGTKCAAGMAYIWYYQRLGNVGDAYNYFYYSQFITQSFAENPYFYCRLLLGNCDTFVSPALFKYAWALGYWNDPSSYFLLRFHALLRPFTGGNYAAHTVVMATLMYAASLQFYKIAHTYCGAASVRAWQNWGIAAAVFGIPSLLFWTSGVHKDGFIYGALSLITLGLHRLTHPSVPLRRAALLRYVAYIGVGVWVFALCRVYLLAVLLPSLLGAVWLHFFPRKRGLQIAIFALLGLLGVYIAIDWLHLPLLTQLAIKQGEFSGEAGGSDFGVLPLGANYASLLQVLPSSFFNALLRPFVWSAKGWLGLFFGAEVLLVLSVAGVLMWVRRRAKPSVLSFFLAIYALGNLLLIGILVSNAGTMVRYRAIAEGLLLLSVLLWQRAKLTPPKPPLSTAETPPQ